MSFWDDISIHELLNVALILLLTMVFKAHGRWIHLSVLFFSFLVLYMIVGAYIEIEYIKKTVLSTISAMILLFYGFVCSNILIFFE